VKYLDMLKKEIPSPTDPEKQKNTYPELPQKPQKGLYGVFGVQQGSTFSEKKAQGYGCAGCGGKVYTQAEIWATHLLPESSLLEYEHSPVMGWKCDKCGSEFQYIGGSRKLQPIN
jgi:DNA-directed RNA polymerase subunit RPC12/RpoP